MDLNQYIVEQLPEHDAVIAELCRAIGQTQKLFASAPFDKDGGGWGYRVLDDKAQSQHRDAGKKESLSQSTISMIAASLARQDVRLEYQASSGFPWRQFLRSEAERKDQKLDDRLSSSVSLLQEAWKTRPDGSRTSSTTYGYNDILSLSWHFDLFSSPWADSVEISQSCEEIIKARAAKFNEATSGYFAICAAFRDQTTPALPDARIGDSSYILLRFVRCLKALSINKETVDPRIRSAMARASKRLQSKLHDHLSLAEITDSRFDPAELAFCLEGLMHLKPEQIDFLLLDRVISVLNKSQEQSAYWRSETPIVIQQRGHVLFPIGVEVARSILNSLACYAVTGSNAERKREIHGRHLTVLHRYWSWLKSRQIVIENEGQLLYGWHSEHINDPDLIHTWETSQVLEFLMGFRALLSSYVADELLSLSRLDVRHPGKSVSWERVVNNYEPYRRAPHNIYGQIGTDFVESRQAPTKQLPRNWSMLLYGPPGTGKSTVAENMGDCLRVPVITVTVSDFLGEGESRMENRVKNIFTVIERQVGAIILFDEMDQFLLDRNSDLFREQDSVFQFLTPGMLTKFAKLRKSETVIFIIATNYEERIDSAIKRTGRIDRHYLVLPPDNSRRMEIMLGIKSCNRLITPATDAEKANVLEASCLLAYTDITRVAAQLPSDIGELVDMLSGANRNIQFSSMAARYAERTSKGIEVEINGLINLVDEAQQTRMTTEGNWEGSVDFKRFMQGLPLDCVPRRHHDELDQAKDNRMYGKKGRRSRAN